MSARQKYVLVVVIGWVVPLAIVFWFRCWPAVPAVAIAYCWSQFRSRCSGAGCFLEDSEATCWD